MLRRPTMGDEFNPTDGAVEVCEVIEPVTLTEITVPLSLTDRPEVALFRAVTEHLEANVDRVAVVSFSCHYIGDPHPMICGVLCTSSQGPGGPMDQLDQEHK